MITEKKTTAKETHLVTGIKSLAAKLGVSVSTVNRMISCGIIDAGIYRYEKTLIFDLPIILDILRVGKR